MINAFLQKEGMFLRQQDNGWMYLLNMAGTLQQKANRFNQFIKKATITREKQETTIVVITFLKKYNH